MTLDFRMDTKKLAASRSLDLEDPSQPISLDVQFATLPDGTNYPANVVLNAPAKSSWSRSRTRTTRSRAVTAGRVPAWRSDCPPRRVRGEGRSTPRGSLRRRPQVRGGGAGGVEIDHLDQKGQPLEERLDHGRAVARPAGEGHQALALIEHVALEKVGILLHALERLEPALVDGSGQADTWRWNRGPRISSLMAARSTATSYMLAFTPGLSGRLAREG